MLATIDKAPTREERVELAHGHAQMLCSANRGAGTRILAAALLCLFVDSPQQREHFQGEI
jgi:hypothetical protein